MTDVHVQPDILVAVIASLSADAALTALTTSISTELADPFTLSLILAEGSGLAKYDGWLWRQLVDFHAIAHKDTGTRAAVSGLARQAHASLVSLRGTTHTGCVITDVATVQLPFWLPDPSFEPAAARFVGQVAITYHP